MIAADQDAQDARMALYQQGMSDSAAARALNVNVSVFRDWRVRRGLPVNRPCHILLDAAEDARRRADYARGFNDVELAERWGIARWNVGKWRRRRKLAANTPDKRHAPEQRAARMLLYSLGYNDHQIARQQKVSHQSVYKWRHHLGIPSIGKPGPQSPTGEGALLRRIKRAMPEYLTTADRDDAVSDLFLAVMSGTIPIAEIEKNARRFGQNVIRVFANRDYMFSLDKELGDESGGIRMVDMLRDERSSSWLEEMGATAW